MAGPTHPSADGMRADSAARRSLSVGTVVLVLTVGFFLLAALVTIFGDPDDGEPHFVLTVTPHARGANEIVTAPVEPLAATTGTPSPSAAALIAANGIVITDPALTEQTPDGPIPVIAADGRKPMDIYARPFDQSDPRPRIAIVVGGLGIGDAVTQAAIDKLPGAVTLSFTPYGPQLQSSVSAARAAGHEVLLELPMEPFDYPSNDPGPNTLMTGAAAVDNGAHLQWLMSRISGYAGVMNMQGAKFLATPDDLRPVVEQVKRRGLYLVDTGQADRSVAREITQTAQAPFVRADQQIDRVPTREGIELELQNLETLAKTRGAAIAVATAYPVTIDRVAAWAATLEEKGIALAPVTAILSARAAAPTPASAEQ